METDKNPTFLNVLIPLFVIIFIIAVGVVLLYQHFQKNLFLQKLKEETLRNNYQNDLLRAYIQAQEEERKRIANDLHDELGAVLSIARMNLVMLEQKNAENPEPLNRNLTNVRSLVETSLASVRSISHRLMPPQLESFGLAKTLESICGQINCTGAVAIALNTGALPVALPWAISVGCYRILMELINNTIKHAGAALVTIDFEADGERLLCRYTDNGKGITTDADGKGLGLKSIDARISVMGGHIGIGPASEAGFSATISIPLHQIEITAQTQA